MSSQEVWSYDFCLFFVLTEGRLQENWSRIQQNYQINAGKPTDSLETQSIKVLFENCVFKS